ncbi:hypothetical protein [Saccharicrinis carchari]|uniref:hypothetical protein n=1 Tax=Saccharicrinis carchari TaxID=1168039 RepID=UPI001158D72D|nr:hypothetical protein [Saccharicrinis carchari]
MIVGLEIIYLSFIGIKLRDSSVFYLELPVAGTFCVLINLIYYILYSRAHAGDDPMPRSKEPEASYLDNFVVKSGKRRLNGYSGAS